MVLVPSCQIYPPSFLDSFQSSLSKFNGSRLHIFRYGSSIPSKKQNLLATQYTINSDSITEENPRRKSRYMLKNNKDRETPVSQSVHNTSFPSRSWIDRWSESHIRNLRKRPEAVVDYRSGGGVSSEGDESTSTGSSTMDKIVEKLKRFGYVDDVKERKDRVPERGSVEDIFYVEEGMLPNTRGGFSAESPLGVGDGLGSNGDVRFPWEKPLVKEEEGRNSVRQRSRTSLAELTLPESELRRLRNLAFRTKHKMKIGGAGVTQAILDSIHEKWKMSEVVRLKCEGAPALNMKRMHEILERKTGGLVIWRSGTSVFLYRGVSYELPSREQAKKPIQNTNEISHNSFPITKEKANKDLVEHVPHGGVQVPQPSLAMVVKDKNDNKSLPEMKYEHEVDKLLEGLGPRYSDWPGGDPLPIDTDLLPGVVPGYKPPFRMLPYGVRTTLGIKEATALRRLARVIPPHFALGRSRQHEGLAVAMVKLWEKSSIAKIALKRGVQLTTSERMAEDIKKMTGGTLLSRNKDYLVFYRGKNFLSPDVTEALVERERLAKALQDEEEQARLRASALVIPSVETSEQSATAGTLGETLEADARWGRKLDESGREMVIRAAEVARHANLVRKIERKLSLAERKMMKAERALAKVEQFLKPLEQSAGPQSITDEERFMFRKLGLRMKAFLLLGRRGVFDGTVENMHLHWKYRELVKVIVKVKTFDQVRNIALSLEAESGGVLVSVDKVSKGFAIIVFRGKDYQRPPTLRPKNLLTKRKALARSIELQRREALYNHISALQSRIETLRSEINQMEIIKDRGDEELYAKLDSAYSTEDDVTEDEGDEAYLETYGNDIYDEGDDDEQSEKNFSYDDQHEMSQMGLEVSKSYVVVEPNASGTRIAEANDI